MELLTGLSGSEANRRLTIYGPNEIRTRHNFSLFKILVRRLVNPLVVAELAAIIVFYLLGESLAVEILFLAVIVNSIFGLIQEVGAERSMATLSLMLKKKAKVKRNGEWREIDLAGVVPGDICRLEIGQSVPADGVLIGGESIYLNEAILTGESTPIAKHPIDGRVWKDFENTFKYNRCYQGMVVSRGIGEMLVVRTGRQTKMAQLAKGMETMEEETSLQRRISKLNFKSLYLAICLVVMVIGSGVMGGASFLETLPIALALGIAVLPEILTVSLTMILSLGLRQITKKKALIRRLPAAEILGSVDVICLDKTGTITEGIMRATGCVTDENLSVSEQVDQLSGQNKEVTDLIMRGAILCNDLRDPLEVAMKDFAEKIIGKRILSEYVRVDEVPFDPKHKYIVTRHRENHSGRMIEFLSGAPEVILKNSVGNSESGRKKWQYKFTEAGNLGYRIVGFSYKEIPSGEVEIDKAKIGNYKWLGVVVFVDPVRAGCEASFIKARNAGIDLKVITGDYKETAWASLRSTGLVEGEIESSRVLLGDELSSLGVSEIRRRIGETTLFARTTPEQKLLIVKLLKEKGLVVAMMGDGVNDAPALSKADIGVVVNNASDVARETADMVLLNNDFATIIAAVGIGRGMFENLRKMLVFVFSISLMQVTLVMMALAAGLHSPLGGVQVLWLNLISQVGLVMGLVMDPTGKEILRRKLPTGERVILNRKMICLISIIVAVGGVGSFVFYCLITNAGVDIPTVRSMMVVLVSLIAILFSFSSRSMLILMRVELVFNNMWLWVGTLLTLSFQLAMLYLPQMQIAFGTVGLEWLEWLMVGAVATSIMVAVEVGKGIAKIK